MDHSHDSWARPATAALLATLGVASPALAQSGVTNDGPATADRPNIIFYYADDLGIGDLGAYGQQHIATPNLDRLAAQGARFTQIYAPAPVCQPSRVHLMTGQHAGRSYPNDPADRPHDTLTHQLRGAGYAVGGFGKWGGGFMNDGDPDDPVGEEGFDYWFGYDGHGDAHHYYPDPNNGEYLWRDTSPAPNNADRITLDNDRSAGQLNDYAPDLMVDDAQQWIEDHQDERFYLYFSDPSPHFHYEIDDLGQYADKDWPDIEKAYAATVTRMDHNVGRLVDKLEALDLDEQTLIVFTSDNGPHQTGSQGFPDQEHDPDFFDSDGPYGGRKRSLGEGGIRMPGIAYWPGTIEPGTVVDTPSNQYDLLPTFMNLIGGTAEGDLDGVSLAPTLMGQGRQADHDYMYWRYDNEHSVRLGDRRVNIRVDESTGDWVFAQLIDVSEPAAAPRIGDNFNSEQGLRDEAGDAFVDRVLDIIASHGRSALATPNGHAAKMPNAVIDFEPGNGDALLSLVLDAGASTDPNGDALTYRWFIDGVEGELTGERIEHTFDEPGLYNVELIVEDSAGHTDHAVSTFRAIPEPGTAALLGLGGVGLMIRRR